MRSKQNQNNKMEWFFEKRIKIGFRVLPRVMPSKKCDYSSHPKYNHRLMSNIIMYWRHILGASLRYDGYISAIVYLSWCDGDVWNHPRQCLQTMNCVGLSKQRPGHGLAKPAQMELELMGKWVGAWAAQLGPNLCGESREVSLLLVSQNVKYKIHTELNIKFHSGSILEHRHAIIGWRWSMKPLYCAQKHFGSRLLPDLGR